MDVTCAFESFILLSRVLKILELETFFWKSMIFWVEYAIIDNIEYFLNKIWWNWWNYGVEYSIKIPKRTPKRIQRMSPVAHVSSCVPFKAWIGHFIKNVRDCGWGISSDCHHLFILDGHSSHVTTDVVKTAWSMGLDLLTLPSHTSHALQPFDVSCFKPFKQAFHLLRDVWTLRNKSKGASKEVMAS
jgi:hypothetical protein